MLAAVCWSTSGLLLKSPPLRALPDVDRGPVVACYRSLFAAACLLPLVSWRTARVRLRMMPMVACFAAMNLLFVSSMAYTTAAVAIFMQYTATAWAFVFGAVFLKERVSRGNLLALSMALIGIVWIVWRHWSGSRLFGVGLALGSGMTYGGVIVALRGLRDEDPAWLIALNHAASGLVLLPWVIARGPAPTTGQWLLLAVLGVFQMGLPYLLFAKAVQTVSAQEASLLSLPEAILNPLWVWLVWGESNSIATWIGGGFILAGLGLRFALFRAARG